MTLPLLCVLGFEEKRVVFCFKGWACRNTVLAQAGIIYQTALPLEQISVTDHWLSKSTPSECTQRLSFPLWWEAESLREHGQTWALFLVGRLQVFLSQKCISRTQSLSLWSQHSILDTVTLKWSPQSLKIRIKWRMMEFILSFQRKVKVASTLVFLGKLQDGNFIYGGKWCNTYFPYANDIILFSSIFWERVSCSPNWFQTCYVMHFWHFPKRLHECYGFLWSLDTNSWSLDSGGVSRNIRWGWAGGQRS